MQLSTADKALADGIAAATAPRGKQLIVDRGPAQPVSGNSFDLAIAAIENGAQRVEVAEQSATPHARRFQPNRRGA
jgi:hypothetical protein